MFGCLRRIGCLVLLLIIAAVLWLTRDQWRARVFGERPKATPTWHPVTSAGSAQARTSVESLGRKTGPVFVNLTPGELGSLLLPSAGGTLPSSVGETQVAVNGDRLMLRAMIQLDDIRGIGDLGPLTNLLSKREPLETSGTLDIVHPGLAEYRVESARLGDLAIPRAAIPKLIARVGKGERRDGVAENGIPFEVPSYIGDVRVARGRVTLYKNVQ